MNISFNFIKENCETVGDIVNLETQILEIKRGAVYPYEQEKRAL